MRDMMGMMKQAQAMQAKIAAAQASLENLTVEGASGGGMVSVSMSGKGDLRSIRIDPSLMQEGEAEIVEDLVMAAFNDARGKMERAVQEHMQEATKGLPLPPGMKLF
jgi:DNA-binding YbaB/EbfC family protein